MTSAPMSASRHVAKGPESTCSKARILMPSNARPDLESAANIYLISLERLEQLERLERLERNGQFQTSQRFQLFHRFQSLQRVHLDSSLMVGNKSCFGACAFFQTITLRE